MDKTKMFLSPVQNQHSEIKTVWEPLSSRHILHWVVKTLGLNMNSAVFQSVGFRLSGEDNTNFKVIQFTRTSILCILQRQKLVCS